MVGKSVMISIVVGSLGALWSCRAGPAPDGASESFAEKGQDVASETGSRSGGPSVPEGEGGWVEAVDSWVYGDGWPRENAAAGEQAPARIGATPALSRASHESEWRREVDRLLRESSTAILEDRVEDAVGLLEAAWKGVPEDESRIQRVVARALGDAYLAVRRNTDAARAYRAVIAAELGGVPGPSVRADVRGNLAVAYLRLGDLEQARAQAEEALRLFPGHSEGLKTLGIVDILEGRMNVGRRRLEESLRGGRRIPEAELMLARLDEQAGRLEPALERYRALKTAYETERPVDTHRRWRDLCIDEGPSTPDVLAARIFRLEELLRKSSTKSVETQGAE
jgi:tetratricopeptide (TPR) repeat protein